MNWTSVKEKMPKSGKNVLATYKNRNGFRRVIVGCFIEQYTEKSDDGDCDFEYCEEKDEYFLASGWYEQQDNWEDWSSIFVYEGEVTHWMPLPDTKGLK